MSIPTGVGFILAPSGWPVKPVESDKSGTSKPSVRQGDRLILALPLVEEALFSLSGTQTTFGRVFRVLDGRVFEACFREWIAGRAGIVEGVVAIDGKTAGSRDGHNTAMSTAMRSRYPAASSSQPMRAPPPAGGLKRPGVMV
jgi:hypothetical protein